MSNMKTTTKIAAASLALAFAAGSAFAAAASENWENHCSSCHGEDGKAQTKQGKKLKIRDYTDAQVQAELKDDEMLKAILEGVKENGKERMKAFKEELENPEQEAKDLVAYIRKFKA
jgi:cytochrome c553